MQKYGQYPILPNFFNKNLSKNDIFLFLNIKTAYLKAVHIIIKDL